MTGDDADDVEPGPDGDGARGRAVDRYDQATTGQTRSPQVAAAFWATSIAWQQLQTEYGLLGVDEVAKSMSTDRATVLLRLCAGDLLAVDRDGQWLFPGYQFDRSGQVYPSIAALRLVADEFERSMSSVVLWMLVPNGHLQDDCPVRHIGDIDAVRRAAHSSFDISW